MRRTSRWVGLMVLVVVIWLAAPPVGSWLGGRSDAAWWGVLPWVLLVVIWAWLFYRIRRGLGRGRTDP